MLIYLLRSYKMLWQIRNSISRINKKPPIIAAIASMIGGFAFLCFMRCSYLFTHVRDIFSAFCYTRIVD